MKKVVDEVAMTSTEAGTVFKMRRHPSGALSYDTRPTPGSQPPSAADLQRMKDLPAVKRAQLEKEKRP